ncbi:MAG: hypothetical protein WC303_00900 [Candidatus Paceibacterota bacterium]|jgi:hypothetical protein
MDKKQKPKIKKRTNGLLLFTDKNGNPCVSKVAKAKEEKAILKKAITAKKETDIQEVVNYYFFTKGLTLEDVKENAKKQKIIYSRFTRPAKELIELAGSTKKAKQAISIVAEWANSRNLDYTIETVFKKWLELGRLKPKEIIKKPYFQNQPMIWSATKKKWFVIDDGGEWLEFAGSDKEIEWRTEPTK